MKQLSNKYTRWKDTELLSQVSSTQTRFKLIKSPSTLTTIVDEQVNGFLALSWAILAGYILKDTITQLHSQHSNGEITGAASTSYCFNCDVRLISRKSLPWSIELIVSRSVNGLRHSLVVTSCYNMWCQCKQIWSKNTNDHKYNHIVQLWLNSLNRDCTVVRSQLQNTQNRCSNI